MVRVEGLHERERGAARHVRQQRESEAGGHAPSPHEFRGVGSWRGAVGGGAGEAREHDHDLLARCDGHLRRQAQPHLLAGQR